MNKTTKTVLILLSVSLVLCLSLQSQTITNSSSSTKGQSLTNRNGFVIPPEDVAFFRQKGYTDAEIIRDCQPPTPQTPEQVKQAKWLAANPTPPDLKNAIVCMDSFLGMTNAMLPADVISIKTESLKFRINGQDYNYSGHYTVTLNTPRQHKNPYFGFGTPETAKVLILENWNGDMLPLQNATIWEKSSGFIDAVALGKEWIYSGTYTIQN